MALNFSPESSRGVLGAIKGALGLFGSTNKAEGVGENSNPQPIDEYESSLDEKDILELVGQWKRDYSVYYTEIEKSQKQAFNYWLGKQKSDDKSTEMDAGNTDNLIFEAVETFLPIATRANPDPLVSTDPDSDQDQKIAHAVKVALVNWADTQKLRRKLAKMTRQWLLNKIGVVKVYWDVNTKEICAEVVKPNRFIFDKDGFVDEGGHFVGEYIGEKKRTSADRLVKMFPKKKEYITAKSQGKMGTKMDYIEWWYQSKDVFYTLDQELLGKYKNPNWNYDGKEVSIDPITQEESEVEVQGTNHLKEMAYPYLFLSIFSTGQQPHDETSLIDQNIPSQDRINRRLHQIEKNVDGMNNGMVVSGTAFTEEQASQAASALRRGVAIRVPNGKVGDAVQRLPAPALPNDVFNSLQDARNELRNIFGTSGSTPEGTKKQDSVRGKILVNQLDSSRIGGGVTEYIEQVADSIYNLVTQLMFVYYDEEHFVVEAGQMGGNELIALKNDVFPLLKTLTITVKEGSLIPKDPLTQRNEAIDLWSAGAIDPLSFYRKLDFPDPAQATQQLILWQMLQRGAISPEMYLPTFQMASQPQVPVMGQNPVNPLHEGQSTGMEAPVQASPEAVQAQGQQLLGAIPV